MDERNTKKLMRSIQGMSTETFVWGYNGQSQMDINTINSANLSARACEILYSIYDHFGKKR